MTVTMQISGHGLELTPALRTYAEKKLSHLLQRDGSTDSIHVVLTSERHRHRLAVNLMPRAWQVSGLRIPRPYRSRGCCSTRNFGCGPCSTYCTYSESRGDRKTHNPSHTATEAAVVAAVAVVRSCLCTRVATADESVYTCGWKYTRRSDTHAHTLRCQRTLALFCRMQGTHTPRKNERSAALERQARSPL
jgi:hypothetical protein